MLDTRNFDNPRDKSVRAVCVVRALLAAAGLGKRGCRKKKITPAGEKIAHTQVKIIGKTSRAPRGFSRIKKESITILVCVCFSAEEIRPSREKVQGNRARECWKNLWRVLFAGLILFRVVIFLCRFLFIVLALGGI